MAETVSKIEISIKGVQEDLSNGLTREQIGEKYHLNKASVGRLFKHEKLKGLKTKSPKEEAFILVDDAPERKVAAKKAEKAEAVSADGSGAPAPEAPAKAKW